MSEHQEQAALVEWFRLRFRNYAGVFFAIPNGGARSKATGGKLKAEGVLPGVPDLMLCVPVGGYHGLFIEMKGRRRGSTSLAQKDAHKALRGMGYVVVVPRGFDAAKAEILEYLGTDR